MKSTVSRVVCSRENAAMPYFFHKQLLKSTRRRIRLSTLSLPLLCQAPRTARQCAASRYSGAPDVFFLDKTPAMLMETLAVLALSYFVHKPFPQALKWRLQCQPQISSGGKLKTMSRRRTSAQPWCSAKSWRSWWVSQSKADGNVIFSSLEVSKEHNCEHDTISYSSWELVLLVAPVKQYECNSRQSYGLS